MSDTKRKPYREKLISTLYSKEYEKESKNWNSYPSNRILVNLVWYSWETDNWNEYAWEKVKVMNFKLTTDQNTWEVVKQVKSVNGRAVDDVSVSSMSIGQFTELLNDKDKILRAISESPEK